MKTERECFKHECKTWGGLGTCWCFTLNMGPSVKMTGNRFFKKEREMLSTLVSMWLVKLTATRCYCGFHRRIRAGTRLLGLKTMCKG